MVGRHGYLPCLSTRADMCFSDRVGRTLDYRAIILVVDSTDRERLPIAKAELHRMATDEGLAGAAMLVLANKQDVKGYVYRSHWVFDPTAFLGGTPAPGSRQIQQLRPAFVALPRRSNRCMNAAQISEGLDLTALKDRQWHIVACSALTGKGLEEGLDWLTLRLSGK